MNKTIAIAIDGPAAAGKSTVAKKIAKKMSYTYIDTGAMYRALTLKAIEASIPLEDEKALSHMLSRTTIDLIQERNGQRVLLDGVDVTLKIRTEDVTNNVSTVAKHESIRKQMLKRQRSLANEGGVVMDGRDIGTHVLPHAEVKVFLIASVEERAKRRYEENMKKGFPSELETLKKDIKQRDLDDSKREVAPLIKADDAIEIDTTSLSIDDVVNQVLKLVDREINV